jgi:two-component system cell cycle sensor histidine kinase/response regulator CckA
MSRLLRVLHVEDSEDDALLLQRRLRQDGFELSYERVETAAAMRAALGQQEWDIVLSDYAMPHFSTDGALAVLRESGLDLPFIVVSGTIGEERAVAAMKAGAHDYLMKQNLTRLVPAVERELREAEGRRGRRQLEEQFRQAQKMEAIGRLAGGVAHDFNNMLGAMIGYCDLLMHQIGDDEPSREYLQEIMKAGDRAATLTRQLLLFSRKEVTSPQVLDLNEAVVGTQKMLARLIGEDVELLTVCDPELGRVKADPGQIEQAVLNLVVNARDAMSLGGRLTIETRNMDVEAAHSRSHVGVPPGSYVSLDVADTGCGMDAETQARIFEPFFTTKEQGKGTGLGLATVYGIVQQSGGHITVDSQLGQGTRFRIYLPRTGDAARAKPEPACAVAPRCGAETVLVVEDEEIVRRLVRQLLSSQGYTVLEAERGAAALRLCAEYEPPIDLLLTDVVMPEMSGRELAEHMALVRPTTKVLYMSGYTDDAVVRHGVLDADIAFIRKPFTSAALTQKMRAVLDAD